MEYVFLTITLAIVGNFILRAWLRKVDREPKARDRELTYESSSAPSFDVILNTWGVRANAPWAGEIQVHSSVRNLLDRYERIAPDEYFRPIDRKLVRPFKENLKFVQIGSWGDGSEVLAKADLSDPIIYLAEIEDASPEKPAILGKDVEDFLKKAWTYNDDN